MKNKQKKSFLLKNSWLYSENKVFINKIYKNFLKNPKKIDDAWKKKFRKIEKLNTIMNNKNIPSENVLQKEEKRNNSNLHKKKWNTCALSIDEKFYNLICAFRKLGHYFADLDPLNLVEKKNVKELSLLYYNITKDDLNQSINIFLFPNTKKLKSYHELYNFLCQTYCGSIGFEYTHLNNMNEIQWLQKYIEKKFYIYSATDKIKKNILKGLIKSETFENFIHTKFPGSKRFSLEGCDILIPILQNIIQYGLNHSSKKIVLGMAHRGRLNVMYNIFKKNIPKMYQNNTKKKQKSFCTGDVKYHMGANITIQKKSKNIDLILLDNPSHLEIITPVVLGFCKSFLESLKINNSLSNHVIPIIVHGDAAFAGQGIIQETLNMSQVPGYCVFGSIHIIINNQIGFTTSKKKYLQSNIYCTDIAKMLDSPIFHVNADHPESVIFIIQLALKFRFLFKKDVFIDLVCYRRLGHNEVDDPRITQPLMYNKIKNHEKIYNIYLKKLNKISDKYIKISQNYFKLYQINLSNHLKEKKNKKNKINSFYIDELEKKSLLKNKIKNFSFTYLIKKMHKTLIIPQNFSLHYQVKKIWDNRLNMITNQQSWDWGAAEMLAYTALILKGVKCRLSGEDVRRGTFSHRHAAIYCQKTGRIHIPLNNIKSIKNNFFIWDSVLSEAATLAFEYGYSITDNFSLNIWEAQFGDFINGAQIIIDQFIISGQQKWGHNSSLVLMLPHGYEGQGPEHSSARIERFLQLCAQKNIRLCVPTTPAQMYHLIQNQGTLKIKKPLIIFTPKSLLRNSETFSTFTEISTGIFKKILLHNKQIIFNKIQKIIFCSGKIYYDLLEYHQRKNLNNILIIRLEQLYPFPIKEIAKILHQLFFIKTCIWCQEEPKNQGSWIFFYLNYQKYISDIFKKIPLQYIGRPKWASTAEGNFYLHKKEQYNIINKAFTCF
ncbi:2-oxoglutarate dehydrogenase E1 component [Buchnera aphidicola]|uniref:2-oxoglutarate dehydrogenase E1 component n=1 Tax=Buchnera aphidicola TaxID=9 RepID=UPI00094D8A8B|nr:2-oxoglutarate dehydrogenase E1 component [Buchnera aphidicola]